MIQAVKARTSVLAIFLALLSIGYTFAQNKVVVVPLGGDEAVQGYEAITSSVTAVVAVGSSQTHTANCPTGKKVLGGGAFNSFTSFHLSRTRPFLEEGWQASARNDDSVARTNTLTVYAICAEVDEA
ncbi:MAG: hypothetical protein AAF478_13725 [Pseudomonadota bacterium]